MQIPGCMLPNTWQTFTVPYIKQVEKKYMTIRYKQDLCSIERMYPTSKQTNEQN